MLRRIERFAKVALARVVGPFLRSERLDPGEFSRAAVERLLVIGRHEGRGEAILAVPALRGIRRRFPRARIVLAGAPADGAVMENSPYVDEAITCPRADGGTGVLDLVRFVLELRRRRFDAAIVLGADTPSVGSMLLSVASGARLRAGPAAGTPGDGLASRFYHLQLPLPSPRERSRMHESERILYPLTAIGVRERDLRSLLVPSDADIDAVGRFVEAAFGPGRDFIVCRPGGGGSRSFWPPRRFAETVALLAGKARLSCVAVSEPGEGEIMDAFLSASRKVPAVLFSPSTGFLGVLLRRASLTLCNDSDTMHLAGAVGARCVALFGPSDPARWKPVNESVVAVRASDGRFSSVSVTEVVDAAMKLIG